jgi:glycosyltransferase involved in cell wall biosynthesis
MISVVLATHNEANNIKKCLNSVKSFADEIIVVDGNSSDDTRQLAKKMGARVIKTTNKKNFHINKQLGLDKAKGQLVLQIDADEAVDEELATFIKDIDKKISKKKNFTQSDTVAWWIKRHNLFLGRWLKKGGQYPDPVIRLLVNGKAGLPQKDVHEQMWVDGQTGVADGHLWHYSYPSFAVYMQKFNTYTSFKAQQLLEADLKLNPITFVDYIFLKPIITFIKLYFRHKGFVDGWPGFVFALFSGLHHLVAYLKFWELKLGEN